MAYRTYSTANGFIVDANGKGDFTTISAACTAATGLGIDIFVHPGSYTENPTIPVGVNIVGFLGDNITPQVTIIGKVTMSAAGTSTISNIRLQTNNDFCVVVGPTNASILNLENCYVNCLNHTGISFTASSSSAQINLRKCGGNIGVNTATLFSMSCPNKIIFQYSNFQNTAGSTVSSTASAGIIDCFCTSFNMPITTSGTGGIVGVYVDFDMGAAGLSTTALIHGGSSAIEASQIYYSYITSGTQPAISISATLNLYNSTINCSNGTHAITGSGTLNYGNITITNTGNIIDVTTATGNLIETGSISFNGGSTSLNAIPVPVSQGGSSLATLTAHAIQVGNGTGAITQLARGSTGQVLQSQGASSDPAWTSATFPTSVGATGTILRSDGTNWSATTATYPNTSTINQVLYSSAANTITGLATANNAVLNTNGSGVPSITATPQITGLGIGAASTGSGLTFDGSNTLANYATGTFTPTAVGSGTAGTTTYSTQNGYYTRIGNLVFLQGHVAFTAATGSGDLTLGGFPFVIKNQTGNAVGTVNIFTSNTWPASRTCIGIDAASNGQTAVIVGMASGQTGSNIQIANTSWTINYMIMHQV